MVNSCIGNYIELYILRSSGGVNCVSIGCFADAIVDASCSYIVLNSNNLCWFNQRLLSTGTVGSRTVSGFLLRNTPKVFSPA